LIPFYSFAQKSSSASLSFVDTGKLDTNYVKFYKDKLVLALWQSRRNFDIDLIPKTNEQLLDSFAVNYIANSNNVSGISVDYDIIGFSFGYRSVPTGNYRTGNTDYFDMGFNINTRGLRFENSWKRYTGFYDANTKNYVKPFNDSVPFTQFPKMSIRVVKSKIIYTFNKKRFALGAAYANVKRQVKTRGSWILVGNFYSMNLYSDSSIIPQPIRNYYGEHWEGLNKMNIYAFSAGFGGTRTFVFWKKFFFNIFASLGLESQYRHYYTVPENYHTKYWKTWFAGDWRTALGYNSKRFFIRLTGIYDITNYESSAHVFKMTFYAGSFDFGYRFDFKAPKLYSKLQETKLYKML
jgi:hypothetical protein